MKKILAVRAPVVRALVIRALAVRALAVRALVVRALVVRALAVRALAVRALAVRAMYSFVKYGRFTTIQKGLSKIRVESAAALGLAHLESTWQWCCG